MSGINSLIDTLLHQEMGRREPRPVASEPNGAVRPLPPVEAPRMLHSDSRLDPRAILPGAGGALMAGQPLPVSPGGRPAPIGIQLSPAARLIADLLGVAPAPLAVIRPQQPLIATTGPLLAEDIAPRLAGSIRDSGLFYESHLARWFHGELPLEQLAQEPQMQQAAAEPAMDEALRGLVRHQLELLVTPALRWEGEPWAGLLMTLLIRPPEARHQEDTGAAPQDGADEQGWRSELTLSHGDLGDIRVSIWLHGEQLAMTLTPETDGMAAQLRTELDRLSARLTACGFSSVKLDIDTDDREWQFDE
ncbi:flagellar hook-length control protein FliK [Zobellella maritima]|uniref:flagellar hook-length control protein FliK n=1 Tax=Zobellella maritima TaxID=2059725 RepID=UPI000E308F25|nr:flagellar hook-length control protein FliK [Zobellella maritima]